MWALLTYPFRRTARRPLAMRRPSRDEMGQTKDVPLGLEGIDLDMVERVNRRNGALERSNGARFGGATRGGSFLNSAETRIDAMPEDETYAARFHRVFQNRKGLKK